MERVNDNFLDRQPRPGRAQRQGPEGNPCPEQDFRHRQQWRWRPRQLWKRLSRSPSKIKNQRPKSTNQGWIEVSSPCSPEARLPPSSMTLASAFFGKIPDLHICNCKVFRQVEFYCISKICQRAKKCTILLSLILSKPFISVTLF